MERETRGRKRGKREQEVEREHIGREIEREMRHIQRGQREGR